MIKIDLLQILLKPHFYRFYCFSIVFSNIGKRRENREKLLNLNTQSLGKY